MKYILRSGMLYGDANAPQMKLKREALGCGRTILRLDGTPAAKTEIRLEEAKTRAPGDVRNRTYLLTDASGQVLGTGHPDYAPEEDPQIAGWPICRLPRVDRAAIRLGDDPYTLLMRNSQNYLMEDEGGKTVLQILHRGLTGGWDIEAEGCFSPAEICGLFVFCRYIEQENEFLVV